MAIIPAAIYPVAQTELTRLLIHAWGAAQPHVMSLLSDPSGVVTRVGDTFVWSGPTGQKVLGGLETLAESQRRIESAVVGIESALVSLDLSHSRWKSTHFYEQRFYRTNSGGLYVPRDERMPGN